MKRDMNIIRQILLKLEESETGYAPDPIEIDGYSQTQIGYHTLLLIEAGLVDGEEVTGDGDEGPVGAASRLTWDGHEFLDAAREPRRWQEARNLIDRIGGASIQVWINVLTKIVTKNLDLN